MDSGTDTLQNAVTRIYALKQDSDKGPFTYYVSTMGVGGGVSPDANGVLTRGGGVPRC